MRIAQQPFDVARRDALIHLDFNGIKLSLEPAKAAAAGRHLLALSAGDARNAASAYLKDMGSKLVQQATLPATEAA